MVCLEKSIGLRATGKKPTGIGSLRTPKKREKCPVLLRNCPGFPLRGLIEIDKKADNYP
jgi:hypothetical protein